MQAGVAMALIPPKPVALNSVLAFRNVVGDSCPHVTAPAAQWGQTLLCSEGVNGLWKVIPLTLCPEALGSMLSSQGAGGVASHLVPAC